MKRLTMLIDSHLLDNGKLDKEYSLTNKMEFNEFSCMDIPNAVYNKLGELEDVLEKYGIDNLEDFIKEYSSRNIKLANDNYDLEQELAELKQKAIVLEKAFELACDPRDDWGGKEYSGTEFNNYHDYFIAEAQKEIAEIGGKDE